MKFFVCVKQVPDTETKIKLSVDGKSIDTSAIKWIVNPYDEFAIEEAVKLRDANPGSQAWVVTVGPKRRTVEALRTALAMGMDEAIAIDAPEDLDSYQTAKALAACIQAEGGAAMVFTGKLAIDDNASSVTQMLAEFLSAPHATVVSKFQYNKEATLVDRDGDGGAKESLQLMSPAVIGANKGLNTPRYASLPGIMKAKKKAIKEVELSSLGAVAAAKTKLVAMELPSEKPPVKMLAGDIAKQTAELVSALRNEAKVL